MYLFVFQRVSGVLLCFGQPEQSLLSVSHGHVGLPKHQQIFAIEVGINWKNKQENTGVSVG